MQTFMRKFAHKRVPIKNNKGYTLVELIVIIAILAVLVSVISYSIGIVFRNRSREAASDFDSLLSAVRISTMSGEYYEIVTTDPTDPSITTTTYHTPRLEMSYVGGSTDEYIANLYTISNDTATQSEDLGAGNLNITYSTVVSTGTPVTGEAVKTSTIKLTYNNETGALDTFSVNNTDVPLTNVTNIILDFGAGYDIVIYPATGYHEFM